VLARSDVKELFLGTDSTVAEVGDLPQENL
jgi:hypothetical protein